MTEKLFHEDAYLKEFTAVVQEVDGCEVVLDRSAFYPESGGQRGDTGFLNDERVVDTQYETRDRNTIVHVLEEEPSFTEGSEVTGRLDWDRRYKIMKLHAASHIMEHYLFEIFGELDFCGCYVNEKHDKSTYKHEGRLDSEKLEKVNELVNEFILEEYDIKRWEDENKPGWYYWKADGIKMPCGGTHPKNTKEIGKVKIERTTGGQGKETVITSLKQ